MAVRRLSAITIGPVRRALLALALGGFGIGTGEFVMLGLLPNVAARQHVTHPAGRPSDLGLRTRRRRRSAPAHRAPPSDCRARAC